MTQDTAADQNTELLFAAKKLRGSVGKCKRSLFSLSLILLFTAPYLAHATDFYVDANGGDDTNPGTIELPWRTIDKVEASTGAFDNVYFQRGETWKETLNVPASNMTFDAYGEGAKPTIDGENTRNHSIHIIGKHDIVIRNFNITNATISGIQFSTLDENITYNAKVINNDFTNMGNIGVRTRVPHDVQLAGFLPYGITVQGNTFTDMGNFAIGLITSKVAPNIISENIILRAGDGTNQTNAMQLAARGLVVEKNIVIGTKGGPNGDGHSIILDWGVPGNLDTVSDDVTIRYNYVSGANAKNEQSGIHIYQGKNSKVYGNVSVNNTIGYKLSNPASTGNEFYNNVAYRNTRAAALMTTTAPISTWRNNIFYGVKNDDVGMTSYGLIPVKSNNVIYNFALPLKFSSNYSEPLDLTDSSDNPLFRSPATNNFSVKNGSYAIGMGVDLTNIFSSLIMPGSVWPSNIALVDKSSSVVWESGAFAYLDSVSGNNFPTLPILVSPANNESRVGDTVEFVWKESTDPDGNDVKYHISYCTDQGLVNCSPADVIMNFSAMYYPGSLGMIVFGMTFIGGVGRRRNLLSVFSVIVLLECMSLTSCSISEEGANTANQIKYTASNLAPDTTYYWKVVADDGNGGTTQSVEWSFSTL